jgi:hypothetical protein
MQKFAMAKRSVESSEFSLTITSRDNPRDGLLETTNTMAKKKTAKKAVKKTVKKAKKTTKKAAKKKTSKRK